MNIRCIGGEHFGKMFMVGTLGIVALFGVMPGVRAQEGECPAPDAYFTRTPASGYVPLTVDFINNSENLSRCMWNFGDGSSSSELNPIHTFEIPGSFTVRLVVYNECNDYDIYQELVEVTCDELSASFEMSTATGEAPLEVTFTNTSTNADTWYWDFGDGNGSNEWSPTHTYNTSGIVTARLDVYNLCGDYISYSVDIEVVCIPAFAYFEASSTEGDAPVEVTFTNYSGHADYLSWDFGDGGWSEDWSPTYTYYSPGTYTVRLSIERYCDGSNSTYEIPIVVRCDPPFASFEGIPTSGFLPLVVNFTNSSINADYWSWDFGDGGWSEDWSPTYTYYTAGTFTVRLTIGRYCDGSTNYLEVPIEVVCEPPVAGFEASPTSGDTPLEVTFTNTSTNADSWYWDFGDWEGSGEWSPTHTYYNPGTYTARLYVYRNCGAEVTQEVVIEVICEPPVASFEASPTSGDTPLEVTFTNTSTNTDSWYWDFGDGGWSDEWSPSHTYSYPGIYTALLHLQRNCGAEVTRDVVIEVICEPPVAGFEASPTSGDTPLEVTFTNTSTNADSWYWDFGNGDGSNDWSPTYTYNSPGTYTARLYLSRYCGQEVTRDVVIEVICEPPVAGFEASPTSGNAPLEVTFTNTSTNADYYSWDFGDGNGSDEWSPTHTYYDPGTYTARLYVYRDCGDDEEDTHEVVINVTPPSVPHPADVNVDFSIKINEAIAYLTGWQQGTNPIAFAIRAAYLWQNGEKYSYDGSAAPPMCWVLAPEVLP